MCHQRRAGATMVFTMRLLFQGVRKQRETTRCGNSPRRQAQLSGPLQSATWAIPCIGMGCGLAGCCLAFPGVFPEKGRQRKWEGPPQQSTWNATAVPLGKKWSKPGPPQTSGCMKIQWEGNLLGVPGCRARCARPERSWSPC